MSSWGLRSLGAVSSAVAHMAKAETAEFKRQTDLRAGKRMQVPL